MKHVHIHISGIVQGVGMRPFVYREAVAHDVSGWVLNAGDGVHIEAHGSGKAVDAFVAALRAQAPAASRIERIDVTPLPCSTQDSTCEANGIQAFRIVASDSDTERTTLVSPDIATCPDCLRELFDPADRRYHYPFINCTNCGPRFTIIRALPYDRAATSMDAFPMCPECAREYADPLNRRFHAQPDACFECGPHITWHERETVHGAEAHTRGMLVGNTREASDAIIERCAELLAAGGIVAIKGLGGFHLACNASNEAAVRELRHRKRRSNKPLAIMVRELDDIERLCELDDVERNLLTGSVRPIVLLRRNFDANLAPSDAPTLAQGTHNPWVLGSTDSGASLGTSPGALQIGSAPAIAPSVAFDLPELGVMLPYTPLQHLLLAACAAHGVRALVMTSGNISEEPIEIDDEAAWEHLVKSGIADALLGNDRAILSRFDDSVVRVVNGQVQLVRRARGYAPQPVTLPAIPAASPCILACGPEQKATLALTRENADGNALCFVSPRIGDVENAATLDAWHAMRTRLEALFDLQPNVLACDLHPSYLVSQWAREQARTRGLPHIEVQHHHAHIASVIAEAAARGTHDPAQSVIGITLDGTGAGGTYSPDDTLVPDGTIWGGEILIANLRGFARVAHLKPWPLPGGAASVRDARRNAFSLLSTCELLDHPGAQTLLRSLSKDEQVLTARMIERGINSPLTSSMGRLLDAIAAILGVCGRATYEGEPAILLEAAATRALRKKQHADSPKVAELDPKPLLTALLDDLAVHESPDALALMAHEVLASALTDAVAALSQETGITTVALSGGVFMNRLLLTSITSGLKNADLTVLTPQDLPFNDGCIAYGQAAVARARLMNTGDIQP